MGAVRLVFVAEFRHRWKSWVALAVLVAVVAGSVMALVAAGRRTASAFPRYVAAYGYDVTLYSLEPLPQLARFPGVVSVTDMAGPATGPDVTCRCAHPIDIYGFSLFGLTTSKLHRTVKLVDGRYPNPSAPYEVLASFTMQRDNGVHLGTVIHVPIYAASQAQAVLNSNNSVPPAGPTVALRVVGIGAAELEFAAGTSNYDVYTTPAFARAVNADAVLFHGYQVRLRHGATDLPRFVGQAGTLGSLGSTDLDSSAATTGSSIHPQAVGWWVLAILAGLAGLAVIGQALGRQAIVEGEAYETLAALGVDRRQLVVLGLARTAAVGLIGAALGVGIAVVASPIAPAGQARLADPSPGVAVDGLVVSLGVLATVVVVLGLGLWPAVRAARSLRDSSEAAPPRPSRVVAILAGAGAPPSTLIGVRQAIERGQGRSSVPVGTALLGTVLAMTALCGTAVFAASLTHLTHTPALYGDAYDLFFTGGNMPVQAVTQDLERDPAVSAITLGASTDVSINHITVNAAVGTPVRGPLLVTRVDGRLPGGDAQVALGSKTMRQVGAHVGGTVEVTLPDAKGVLRTAPFRVVGTTAFPPDFPGGGLGRGAVFTRHGIEAAACPSGPDRDACMTAEDNSLTGILLVSVVPGATGRAAVAHYLNAPQYVGNVRPPLTPATLINAGEAVNFPLILGVVLGLFGGATLVHLLVVSVTRRRREMGLLKALGFLQRQVGAAVSWQATTVVLVGVVVGIPLGIAAGNVAWRAFASNLGVVAVPVVTAWVIAAVAAGALILANLLALLPAFVAARSHPGDLLRTT